METNNVSGLVLASDKNYFKPLVLTINNLRRVTNLPIAVLDGGLEKYQALALQGMGVELSPPKESKNRVAKTTHLSKAAFLSLESDFFGFNKFAFLDLDLAILSDPEELISTFQPSNMDFRAIRGGQGGTNNKARTAPHTLIDEIPVSIVDRISKFLNREDWHDLPAYNSGVFVTSSELIFELRESVEPLFEISESLKFADQTLINLGLAKVAARVDELGDEWNWMGAPTAFYHPIEDPLDFSQGKIPKLYSEGKRIHVVHFSGKSKPWAAPCQNNNSLRAWHLMTMGSPCCTNQKSHTPTNSDRKGRNNNKNAVTGNALLLIKKAKKAKAAKKDQNDRIFISRVRGLMRWARNNDRNSVKILIAGEPKKTAMSLFAEVIRTDQESEIKLVNRGVFIIQLAIEILRANEKHLLSIDGVWVMRKG